MNKKPLLLHIPHASRTIPDEYKNDYMVDLSDELYHLTDWYTDELFDFDTSKVVFPISRLVCDVERFRDDRREKMFRCGMGTCYTHGYKGTLIRSLSEKRKEAILKRWYDPHHDLLKAETNRILDKFGVCFIVDCHSFSATPLPYETNKTDNRPDICIGTDHFHTPKPMAERLVMFFLQRGYSVEVNTPFSGTMVPLSYYHTNTNVISVMIEVNRGLYLDDSFHKAPTFSTLKQTITAAIYDLMNWAGY